MLSEQVIVGGQYQFGGLHAASPIPPARVDWWHRFEMLLSLHLPDLTGKSVLDVGAADGYFSFAAERMGASRVVALDTGAWRQPGGKSRFDMARVELSSNVEEVELDLLDISPETIGQFDVVLFLGLLYHMRHPLLALERVASVTNELLVVETLVDMSFLRSPAAAFYPTEILHDETNWWGPNRAAVLGMLHAVGFKRVVPFQLKRLSATHILGLPARAKIAGELMHSTPRKSRRQLVADFARHALTQNHMVAHSWAT
jgi:tRNA (mo5U34)-methyltransferase